MFIALQPCGNCLCGLCRQSRKKLLRIDVPRDAVGSRWSTSTVWRKIIFVALVSLSFGISDCAQFLSPPPANTTPSSAAVAATTPGNEACAKCHSAIAATYAAKPMARGSGPATQDFLPGEFRDAQSGVLYRVYLENGDAWLSFDRDADPPLHGRRKLGYFIGSGHRGKTFVFSDDGFSFESPINSYSRPSGAPGGVWDMAPKHQGATEMPLNSPAFSSCLSCHTSDAQAPEAGTENKYPTPLFAHGGITCERCHGGDLSHGLAAQKPAKSGAKVSQAAGPDRPTIINPSKLTPARRDAVCMQCHLEGNAAIEQPGRHLYEFRPGDDLSDFVRYYVLSGDGKDSVRAVSQFEALAQSACKRATGDEMTCTTCHNPHASPSIPRRAAYYRAKCLACHGEPFAAKHHVQQQDCTTCHMPRVSTIDVGHTQDSDHRILRLPVGPRQGPSLEPQLTRFPPVKEEDSLRGLALAWVSMGGSGSQYAIAQAEKILPQALAQKPDDPELLAALAFEEQQKSLTVQAREHYEHALRIKPLFLDAEANLALIEANAGNLSRAAALWKSAFARAPGRSSLGINLARAMCLTGHGQESKAAIARVLEFNPDLSTAREMLKQLESGEVSCEVK
jgi:tetratricopeptide (TPR) repeat protein